MHLNLLFLIALYSIFVAWYWKRRTLNKYKKFLLFLPIFLAFFWELIIIRYIATPARIGGNDMNPNFINGQYYMIKRFNSLDDLKRGDVVVLEPKETSDHWIIKRIIGLPNDRVKISKGKVFVNDSELAELYLSPDTLTQSSEAVAEDQLIVIPENQYFVLGDNREVSKDSRLWGTFPKENIIGTTWFRYY